MSRKILSPKGCILNDFEKIDLPLNQTQKRLYHFFPLFLRSAEISNPVLFQIVD